MLTAKFFNRIISRSLRLAIFLTPLFFVPLTFDFFEFNKTWLVLFLVTVAWLAWLAKVILVEKKIVFRKTPLETSLLLFTIATFLSALFAIDKLSAFWGYYGRFSDGFLFLISLIIFVLLLVNNPLRSLRPENLLKIFLWSSALVTAGSVFLLIGFWKKFFFLPEYATSGFFTPVSASFGGLGVFLAFFCLLLLSLFYFGDKKIRAETRSFVFSEAFFWIFLVLALFLLFFLNFTAAWLTFSLGLFLLIVFLFIFQFILGSFRTQKAFKVPLLALFLFVLAAAALFGSFDFSFSQTKMPPREVVLPWRDSLAVATNHFLENPVLGAGPGNYALAFSLSRPVDLNYGNLWQIRFDRAGSHFLEIFSTWGILGFLTYAFLLVSFLFVCLKLAPLLFKKGKKEVLVFLFPWLTLLGAQIFYYQNAVLAFSFWLMTALMLLSLKKVFGEALFKKRVFDFRKKPEWGALLAGLYFVALLVFVVLAFFGGRFYLADASYAKVVFNKTSDNSTKLSLLDRTTWLNPYQPVYWALRSRLYLGEIKDVVAGGIKSKEETEKLGVYSEATIKSAKRAADLAGQNVVFWENLGVAYREMRGFTNGADLWAQESFKKALALEPTNPVLAMEAGKAFLAEISGSASAKNSNQLKEAESFLQKAVELKSDYKEARVFLAMVRELQEKPEEAVAILKELTQQYPSYVDGYYQLGRVYFNQNMVGEAIEYFRKVIELSPRHSNALYSLGVAYKIKNDRALALEYFQKVLELNPNNQDVKAKIKELEQ